MRLIFGVFFEKNEKKSVILPTISGFAKKKVSFSRNSTFLQKITFFEKNIYKAKTGFWDTPKIQKWRFSLIFLNFFLTNFGPSGAMRIWWIWTWGYSKIGQFWGLSGLGGQKCSINRTLGLKCLHENMGNLDLKNTQNGPIFGYTKLHVNSAKWILGHQKWRFSLIFWKKCIFG